MKPRAVYKDPFRLGDHVLVMCDTYTPAGAALPTNTRAPAADAFVGKEDEEPWFGLEQEYTLFNLDQTTPLGWPKGGFPGPQGPYCESFCCFISALLVVCHGLLKNTVRSHSLTRSMNDGTNPQRSMNGRTDNGHNQTAGLALKTLSGAPCPTRTVSWW